MNTCKRLLVLVCVVISIAAGAACDASKGDDASKPTASPEAIATKAQSYSVDDIGKVAVPTLDASEKVQVAEVERKIPKNARHRLRFAFANMSGSPFFVVYDDGGYPNGDPSGRQPPLLNSGPGFCYDPVWNEVVQCLRNTANPP